MSNLKKLLTGLMNAVIVFTMVMLPNAYNFSLVSEGIVFANEVDETTDRLVDSLSKKDDCVDEDNNQVEGYYQKGCAFKESQIDMQEWGGSWTEIEVINYLFLMVMSMAFIVTLGNQIPTISRLDCPANQASTVTINIVRVAAIVHILQEIVTSAMYKEAASEASSIYVDGSKTDENVDAQVAAFDKLIEVYEKMKTIAMTKLVLHSVMEAAYIVALGYEIGNIIACSSTCTANRTAAEAAFLAAYNSQVTAATTASTELGTAQAAIPLSAGALLAGCGAYSAAIAEDQEHLAEIKAGIEARAAARTADIEARDITDNTQAPGKLATLLNPAMAATTAGTAAATEATNRSTLDTALAAESAQDATVATLVTTHTTRFNTSTTTLKSTGETCATTVVETAAQLHCTEFMATCTLTAPACRAACEASARAASLAANAAVRAYNSIRPEIMTALQTPVLCCGSIPGKKTPIYLVGPPAKSQIAGAYDNSLSAAGAAFYPAPPLMPGEAPLGPEKLKMVKALVYDGMMNFYMRNMKFEEDNPKGNLEAYSKYSKRVEMMLNSRPQDLLKRPLSSNEVKLALQNGLGLPKNEGTERVANAISRVTFNLFIPTAYAGVDIGSMIGQIGAAVGVALIALMFKAELQYYLLATPTRRSILYAFMVALGGVQIGYDGAAIVKIDEYIKATKMERERFMKAATLDTSVEGGEPGGPGGPGGAGAQTSSGDPRLSGNNGETLNCDATAGEGKGDGEVRKSEQISMACKLREEIPSDNPFAHPRDAALNQNNFDFGQAAPLAPVLNTMGNEAGPGHEGIQGGKFGETAGNVSKAMKATTAKLLKDYKKMLKDRGDDDKDSKSLANVVESALAGNFAKGNSNLTAAVASVPGTGGESKDGKPQIPKFDFSTPGFQAPIVPAVTPPPGAKVAAIKNNTSGDVPKHGLREGPEEKSLDDFKINHNDIAKKPGVSIFKLLSNRYLHQYQKLFKAKQVEEKPVIKAEKTELPPEKAKLKKLLNETK